MKGVHPLDEKLIERMERMALEHYCAMFGNYLQRAVNDLREIAALADREAGRPEGHAQSMANYAERLVAFYPIASAEIVTGSSGTIPGEIGSRALTCLNLLDRKGGVS
jgi:hypothetical protein